MKDLTGEKVIECSLESTEGRTLNMPGDLIGQWTLFYYYPKDDTPGCTVQACEYRDNIEKFNTEDIKLYGVSLDDLDSHEAFISKFDLNFPLLVDKEAKLSTWLGTFGEKERNGKTYKGLSRDTFLINPEGKIEKIWRSVDPKTTVSTTLEESIQLIS